MSDIRLVDAPLEINFSKVDENNEAIFKREYDSFSESHDDPIGQWLRLAKAKGDTRDSDQILLTLVVELHRKIDELNAKISNTDVVLLDMEHHLHIESIGYEHFKIDTKILEKNVRYYGRITMPLFPKRDLSLFFDVVDESIAKIKMMHERDVKDWSAYITARERAMIRELKGL